jgi:hypothetical protein
MYKCCPSPTKATDCTRRPDRTSHMPNPKLTSAVLANSATPQSGRATGCGCKKLSVALYRMKAPAIKINAPSKPTDKYSILPWP